MAQIDDCIIIGAGPAGLTAAIYLARYHLSIRLFDNGSSRAALIPRTHNHAGYPGGVGGKELLRLMREQALQFGAVREEAEVTRLVADDDGFSVCIGPKEYRARTVLLATGVVNHRPEGMADDLHDEALARGLLRYCPVCDGYEVTDKRVGVIGTGERGRGEALFLRGYTSDLTLIAPDATHALADDCIAALDHAGVVRVDGPSGNYAIERDRLVVATAQGRMAFDSVYPALGSQIRSDLAIAAGARGNDEGCLEVDSHQRTSIPGLFAAGDVVLGLDQISNAMGQAGVAATTIRNALNESRPIRR